MSTSTDSPDEAQETLKEWARRIAADAPPFADDHFHQVQAIFVGSARHPRPQRSFGREDEGEAA